ncbi:MAG: cupredoxin domain-containing protein [Pseudomonadota bacterium]
MRLLIFAAAALVAFASPALPSPYPVQRVDLANFRYAPKPIVLAAGKPVTLMFVNVAKGGHNFNARDFFARSRILAGSAPGGRIELSGGQTRSVTLVPSAGTYRVHCSHFLHSSFGMTATILVR